jgi:hypothetical integral membrane protein (TIGR02206 family)
MEMPLAVDLINDYRAFSPNHFLILTAFALATIVACAVGIKHRGSSRLRRAECLAGWVMLGLWTITTVYWLLPANYGIGISLPLHMCDLTGLLAPIVLLTTLRWPRTLLYFWGLGLSINGILTPVLDHGPLHLTFWLYWLTHTAIIGTAIYDVIARDYRPNFRDCLIAIGACAIWLATVLAVDLSLDLNYGYVGNVTPERPTVIHTLGPWPLRVYKMIVAVLALFMGMWLPWAIARRVRAQTASEYTPPSSAAGR